MVRIKTCPSHSFPLGISVNGCWVIEKIDDLVQEAVASSLECLDAFWDILVGSFNPSPPKMLVNLDHHWTNTLENRLGSNKIQQIVMIIIGDIALHILTVCCMPIRSLDGYPVCCGKGGRLVTTWTPEAAQKWPGKTCQCKELVPISRGFFHWISWDSAVAN